jgi:hypothetical protein
LIAIRGRPHVGGVADGDDADLDAPAGLLASESGAASRSDSAALSTPALPPATTAASPESRSRPNEPLLSKPHNG